MIAIPPASPTLWAHRLAYAGLIPFVGLALTLWFLEPSHHAVIAGALLGYSATIASFIGAIYWGLVMRDAAKQSQPILAWGVLPSLLAWLALLAGSSLGLFLMAGLLWLCFAVDRVLYPRFQVQGWLPMRLTLTAVASASCTLGALRILPST